MARPRSIAVRELAEDSGLEVEAVLVTLWGVGIEYADLPTSKIRADHVVRAKKAIGLVGANQRLVKYWERELGVERAELVEILVSLGMKLDERSRTVPSGAVKKLVAHRAMLPPTEKQELVEKETVPLQWKQIGQAQVKLFLSANEVLDVHSALERDFHEAEDPISPPGVRSMDLLESAVMRPKSGFLGEQKYQTLSMAAAALVHSLVHNHPFHNGNKRAALVSMLVMLDASDYLLDATEEELYRFMLSVAAHSILPVGYLYEQEADAEVLEIAKWIQQKSRQVAHGERSVPWREMQRILKSLGCEITAHRGDKMRISRRVISRSRAIFRPEKVRELEAFYVNSGDGREVPKSLVKRMRESLELDEAHKIDSHQFYVERREPDAFIVEYSGLLRKLARV